MSRMSRGGRRRSANGPAAASLGDKLLKAAARVVAERGPLSFSLREVARRARVSERRRTGTSPARKRFWPAWLSKVSPLLLCSWPRCAGA